MVSIYIVLVVYGAVLYATKKQMSRYFVLVEERAQEGEDEDDLSAPVFTGRSFADMADALAFSVWLFDYGVTDCQLESDYIELEREAFTFRSMVKNLKLQTFEEDIESNRSLLSSKTKFTDDCCSICLCDFIRGDDVRVVPNCKHTFHAACLESWLKEKYSCPNCNLRIPK